MLEVAAFSVLLLVAVVICFTLIGSGVKPVPVNQCNDEDMSGDDCFDEAFIASICLAIQKKTGCWVSQFEVREVLQELSDRGHLLVIDAEFETRNSWMS